MPIEATLAILGIAILANVAVLAAIALVSLRGRAPGRGHDADANAAGDRAARGSERRTARAVDRSTSPGRGPNPAARGESEGERPVPPPDRELLETTVRLIERERHAELYTAAATRRRRRTAEDDIDEVLETSLSGVTYSRTIRILAWAFIFACFGIVSMSGLWKPVQPQIFTVLVLAGVFVLVVHELMPPAGLGAFRFVLEGSAAIIFLTMLVVMTGKALSPFFFVYPLLVGAAALVAAPRVTIALAIEAAGAYVVVALTEGLPSDGDAARQAFAYVTINLTALALLTYAGMVISREQRRTRNAAIRLSAVDSLTDLYNRGFFFSAVDREIQRSRRFQREFCLLMMDLDGLKAINDRYGHYHGDLVLRGVARVIRAGLRSIDVAARYGGDEFVALLPETDPSGAYVAAEKIRQGVAQLTVEAGGQKISTSLSIGVVSYPDDGQTADELMIAADEAMYSSKRLGKNRVVGFAEPGTSGQAAPGASAIPFRPPAPTPGFRPLPRDPNDQERTGPT